LGDYDLTSHWLCGVALDPAQLYSKFLIRQYKPIGERALPDNNETRTQIPELNDVALQLEQVNPDDTANKALFDQGLEAFMKNLPAMPSIQTTYPFAFGNQYWSNWPTAENNYSVAANWWAQFLFVIGGVQPATQ
jgi:peptide/nickel transport system substrate-binding protein